MLEFWFGAFASSLNFTKIQHNKIICLPIGHCCQRFCVIQIWNVWLNDEIFCTLKKLKKPHRCTQGEKVRIGISLIKVLAARHAGSGWLARPYRRLMSSACRGKPARSHSSGEEQHLGLVSLFSKATIMKPYTWHLSINLGEEPTVTLQITQLFDSLDFPQTGKRPVFSSQLQIPFHK